MIQPSMLQTGSTYNITYTNADGATSNRKIDVYDSWNSYGNSYIKAYCRLTAENRTFRLDRIESACRVTDLDKDDSYPHKSFDYGSLMDKPLHTLHSMPDVIIQPARPAAPEAVYKRQAGAHPVLVTLSALFVIFAFWAGFADGPSYSSCKQTATAAAAPAKTVKPPPVKTEEWERAVLQRKDHYRTATGFGSDELLNIYTSADLDYDNVLSWHEIDMFQTKLNRDFRYIHNDTALTPVDFLNQGGGDCEDWSIFTCGMLRFWGYTAYVGVVDGGGGTGLHAIALFYKSTPPANASFSYYRLDEPCPFYDLTLPAGCYLPIDYDHAGSFSNASRPDSPLHNVYRPEEIYGSYM